ncbi:16S rRNA (guanine(527)-N(7))-methyltransferase RsmG [Mesoplasma lactucae]|uniref:Ribosomal RNA small subunit methyltransferase G n=1 Tax=Mesoplasma lactucae ATCC 49193 TaxID=81460 RepID=A0A291ISM7_9MOLU|nr:16S rRNA (guanine(527)-N(7))-methyltransferase RsmG [Mesoplasma lactucae]ATG97728.1 16S rRNA (guanine(527)-N(7))-methyltransferase RsmG [Mesoplasma lactucae ATCC 49193]ATZ20497.1 16S rRNA (guanine527-N7)-methyltransferase [Mesoplasma lactucae ATCC 49193]MCL8216668.1 Ribosomal RNA small subunit methyltransferase G [Mesoplasma lactucae ATCC 49193]
MEQKNQQNNTFDNWSIFDECKNINLTDDIKKQLNDYYNLVVEENNKYNLTRITDENDFYEKHIVDSLLFTNVYPIYDQKMADIGSGAGFPGIVLKIFFPETKITLIESNNKKANFLNLAISRLGLKDIEVSSERAEVFSVEHKEEFDVVISRAVAYLDIILEIGVQMLKVDGVYILLKGPRAQEEMNNSGNLPTKLNLSLKDTQILSDTGFGTRVNLFYQKNGHTDAKYPRKYATIKKESGINK